MGWEAWKIGIDVGLGLLSFNPIILVGGVVVSGITCAVTYNQVEEIGRDFDKKVVAQKLLEVSENYLWGAPLSALGFGAVKAGNVLITKSTKTIGRNAAKEVAKSGFSPFARELILKGKNLVKFQRSLIYFFKGIETSSNLSSAKSIVKDLVKTSEDALEQWEEDVFFGALLQTLDIQKDILFQLKNRLFIQLHETDLEQIRNLSSIEKLLIAFNKKNLLMFIKFESCDGYNKHIYLFLNHKIEENLLIIADIKKTIR